MKSKRRPTVIDVAREANVALGTVSRFLNGQNLRKETRRRLEEAVEKLDFRVNPVAQAIKSSRTRTLGFVTPNFDGFNAMIMGHLVESFREKGYSILIFSHAFNQAGMEQAVTSAADRRIDGLVFSGDSSARETLTSLVGEGIPIVIYNNDITGLDVDKVLVRDQAATTDAVRRIISFGHSRVGISLGDPDSQTAINRRDGYRDALKEAGIPFDPALEFHGGWSREAGYKATEALLRIDDPPTAIYYCGNRIGLGGLDYMNESGLRPGIDLSIVSFDDNDVFRMHRPGVAAVAQPVQGIWSSVAQLMASRLDGKAPANGRSVYLDCTFIQRPSLTEPQASRA